MAKVFINTYRSRYHNPVDILRDEMHQFESVVFSMEDHMLQRYACESSVRMMNSCIIYDELTRNILPVNARICNVYAADIYLQYGGDWRFSLCMNLAMVENGPMERWNMADLDIWIVHTAFVIALAKGIHYRYG